MTTDRDEEGRGQGPFIYTQKVRVSKLNTYKTLAYAVTYLKMLSTTQNYNLANRKCVKHNLRFYFCFCF